MEGRGSGTRGGDRVVLQWLLRTMASDTRLKLYPGQCYNLSLLSPSPAPTPLSGNSTVYTACLMCVGLGNVVI